MNYWTSNLRIETPKRRVFYSFHYGNDCWRTQQIRNIGALDGNKPVSANDWETLKRTGEANVKRWINEQLKSRTCTIVLVGEQTATRPFVIYEIERSWTLGLGVFGIYIHGLEDQNGNTSSIGPNPFNHVNIDGMWYPSSTIDIYDAGYKWGHYSPYNNIASNISDWIEDAIQKRKRWIPNY